MMSRYHFRKRSHTHEHATTNLSRPLLRPAHSHKTLSAPRSGGACTLSLSVSTLCAALHSRQLRPPTTKKSIYHLCGSQYRINSSAPPATALRHSSRRADFHIRRAERREQVLQAGRQVAIDLARELNGKCNREVAKLGGCAVLGHALALNTDRLW